MDKIRPIRKYDSTRRKAQARQTRLQILEAARGLFYARGYHGTTIESIAQEAGVALETVYAAFRNKQTILMALIDVTVVGDDEPIPLLQRPDILNSAEETDQKHLLQKFSADIYDIMERMSPLFALIRSAAKSDLEIEALQKKLLAGRLEGMNFLIRAMTRNGPLRPGITLPQAAETVWVISSAEVYHLLVVDLGWSKERYVAWMVDMLSRALLP